MIQPPHPYRSAGFCPVGRCQFRGMPDEYIQRCEPHEPGSCYFIWRAYRKFHCIKCGTVKIDRDPAEAHKNPLVTRGPFRWL